MTIDNKRPFPFITRLGGFSEELSEEETHELLERMFAELEKYEQKVKERLS